MWTLLVMFSLSGKINFERVEGFQTQASCEIAAEDVAVAFDAQTLCVALDDTDRQLDSADTVEAEKVSL